MVIFLDVEKAYDMWVDGLLVKMHMMSIRGHMFHWVMDFLNVRSIEVKIISETSRTCLVENGTS